MNQIRMKIGVMFGSPETTTGGNALKFYASVRLDIRRIGADQGGRRERQEGPRRIGNRTRVKVVKNKMAPPFREVEFDILYGQGICRAGDIVDLATELGIIEKSGAWFSFGGERIGQGRENAKAYLEQRPELMEKLEGMILAKHNIKRNGAAGAAAAEEKRRGREREGRRRQRRQGRQEGARADGKPVVRIGARLRPAPKNGAGTDDGKRSASQACELSERLT
ncbi:MAG: hypothetical protein QM811_09285 [Pirellulales bacterium]